MPLRAERARGRRRRPVAPRCTPSAPIASARSTSSWTRNATGKRRRSAAAASQLRAIAACSVARPQQKSARCRRPPAPPPDPARSGPRRARRADQIEPAARRRSTPRPRRSRLVEIDLDHLVEQRRAPRRLGRRKLLRPMIEPEPPPARIWRISSRMPSVSLASPPENTTSRLPLNAHCMTWRTRAGQGRAVDVLGLVDRLGRVQVDARRSAA